MTNALLPFNRVRDFILRPLFLLAPTPSFISISFQRKHHERPTNLCMNLSRSTALASRRRCGRRREGRAVSFRINALSPSRINFLPHHSFLASLSFSQPAPSPFFRSFAALLLRGLDARARRISEYQWRRARRRRTLLIQEQKNQLKIASAVWS